MRNLNKVLIGTGLALVTGVSFAALPAAATTAFTDVQTAITDVLAAVWPVVAAVVVGFMTIKLVKKGIAKAA